jgi:hypothetical protein
LIPPTIEVAGASFGNQIRDVPDGGQIQVIVGPKAVSFRKLEVNEIENACPEKLSVVINGLP